MYSKSLKPLLMTNAIRSPFLSNSAFVATVVPIRIHLMYEGLIGSLAGINIPVS